MPVPSRERERERERDASSKRRKSTTDNILEEILSDSDDGKGVLATVEEVEFARLTLTQVEMQSSLRSLDTQLELRLKDMTVTDLLCGSKDPADCVILSACKSPSTGTGASGYGLEVDGGQDDDALVFMKFNAYSKMSPAYARVGACLNIRARSLDVNVRIRVLSALLEMAPAEEASSGGQSDSSTEVIEVTNGPVSIGSDQGQQLDGEVVRTQLSMALTRVNFYLQEDIQEAFAQVSLDQVQLGASRLEDGVERWSGRLGNLVVLDLTLPEDDALREMVGSYRSTNDPRPLLLFETKVNQASREEWIDEVSDHLTESGKGQEVDAEMPKSNSAESNLDALLESLLDESPPSSPNPTLRHRRRRKSPPPAAYKGLTGEDYEAFASLPLPVIPFRRETRVEARLLRCRVCPGFLHKFLNYAIDGEAAELLRSAMRPDEQHHSGKKIMQFDSITVTLSKLQLELLSVGLSDTMSRVLSLEIENVFLTNAYFLADPQMDADQVKTSAQENASTAVTMHIFERVDLSVQNISLLVDHKEEGAKAIKSVDNLCINAKFASIVGKTGVTCRNTALARRFKWRTEQLHEDRKVLEVRMPIVTFAINAYQVVGLMSLIEQFKDVTLKAMELFSAFTPLRSPKDEQDTDAVFLNIPDFDHTSQEEAEQRQVEQGQETATRCSHKFVLIADGLVVNLLNSAKSANNGTLSLTIGNGMVNLQRSNGLEILLVNVETVEARLVQRPESGKEAMAILESQHAKESLLQFRYEQEDCFSKIYTRISQPAVTIHPKFVKYAANLYSRIEHLGKCLIATLNNMSDGKTEWCL